MTKDFEIKAIAMKLNTPLENRFAKAEEIANIMVFLASDESYYSRWRL